MNSMQRMRAALAGEPVDRPPNFDILMQYAAHRIGARLHDYYLDYRVLVAANLAALHDFDLDIVQTISDPYRETVDLGGDVTFPDDGLPVAGVPLIQEPDSLDRIKPVIGARMTDRLHAIRALRERVGGEVPVMGWVEGALALAADLRGVSTLMLDLVDRPDWVIDLLEICAEVEIGFARAQVEAGADIIGLGDAVASQVSPRMYRRFGLPYEQRIFAAVAPAVARLHICGDTSRILADMAASGAQLVDIDWMVDMGAAVNAFGDVAVCGNVDPVGVMLQGTPDAVYTGTRCCMTMGGPRFFSAAGCEIPDGTPLENLHAQSRALADGR